METTATSNSKMEARKTWGKLPNEMKLKIVKNLDCRTINHLKSCSSDEKAFFDSLNVPRGTVQICFAQPYRLTFRDKFGVTKKIQPISPDQIYNELRKFHLIYKLYIEPTSHGIPDECFIPKDLSVEHLVIPLSASEKNHRQMLERFDANFLKSIKYSTRGNLTDQTICSLPQIVNAAELDLDRNIITDQQLLNFKAHTIKLGPQTLITRSGLKAFIKKCVDSLSRKQCKFDLFYPKSRDFYLELIAGLDLVCDKKIGGRSDFRREVEITSPCQNFILYIVFSQYQIVARSEAIEFPTYFLGKRFNRCFR